MRVPLLLVLLTVFLLVSSSFVRAHDDDEVVIEDVEKGTTGEQAAEGQAEEEEIHLTDLHFSHLFPEAPLGNIESGKVAHILIGVSNDGDTEYTVQNLEASFRFHMDFNQVLQNFTTYRYGVPLKPGEQATLSYRWPIQALFEPAEFGFTLLVTYEDADGIMYQSPGFNGTITVVDPIRTFDLQMLFILIFLAVAFGGAGYYAYMNVTGGKPTAKFSSQLSKPAAPETKEEKKERKKDVDMSWIPDHNIKKSPKLGTK